MADSNNQIHFGTDGWRAIIGEGFTEDNVVRVVDAAARVFKMAAEEAGRSVEKPGRLYVGHDCRLHAHRYAQLVAAVAASHGFEVLLTQDYCPTPTLCWHVAHDDEAVGGIMVTSSHNPAEYLGIKLRMADGGASPATFTDEVEKILPDDATDARGPYQEIDFMGPYLDALRSYVNEDIIREAGLRVVVDPLYGAGRKYLADLLRSMGVEVCEIDADEDPTFDGLHPEPIPPWVDRGLAKVKELGYDALFINDGDADRIGGGDEHGNFVNPHRIITLIVSHMVEDRDFGGRVVSTVTASSMLTRMCERLGLELSTTPVGFKWIYGEMTKGDVLLGGEESGGIGIPGHVKERDGLLMALLLTEMMAQRHATLGELVQQMFEEVGRMEFARQGLTLTDEQMERFRTVVMNAPTPKEIAGVTVVGEDRRDGVKLLLEDDAWVMMRPSGTEPLVRIYAEAESPETVNRLLAAAEKIVRDE